MSISAEQRRLAAIMFTDMVGYTALAQRNEALALELLEEHREILRSIFPRFNGTEIKTIGDAFLIEFQSALEAAQCAIEIQRTLAKRNHDVASEQRIELRIGIHIGDVVHREGDVYGDGVNIASRIQPLADVGGICISMDAERQIRNALEVRFEKLAPTELKNVQVPMDLFRIVLPWEKDASLKPEGRKAELRERRAIPLSWIGAAVLLLIVIAGWFFLGRYNTGSKRSGVAELPDKSIAVLPFENLSEEKANAYFADGMQDEILARLSKIADLKVISRTSTQKYKSAPDNLREIAKQLAVANILEGSVQKAADQVRVTVQLINATTDAHLWAETYDRKLTDIFAVESDIAKTIADTLQAKLTGSEKRALAAQPTENSEAHDLYLRGLYFFGKRGAENLKRATDYFNQAIAKDPNYALAYAALADSYVLLPQYSSEPPADDFDKARLAADRAIALDNKLAEGHVARGLLFENDYNLKQARPEYQRAIELNPNDADAHYFLGLGVLTPLGDFDHAVSEMNRALELDPFSVVINANLGWCYYFARRYPEAIVQIRKTTELGPGSWSPHVRLGRVHEVLEDREQAITEYQKAYDLGENSQRHQADRTLLLATIYALKGERAKALEQIDQVRDLAHAGKATAYYLALNYLRLGDKSQAIDWLEQSYRNKEPFIAYIKVEPLLDPLRGEPRFEELVTKVLAPKNGSSP